MAAPVCVLVRRCVVRALFFRIGLRNRAAWPEAFVTLANGGQSFPEPSPVGGIAWQNSWFWRSWGGQHLSALRHATEKLPKAQRQDLRKELKKALADRGQAECSGGASR